MMYTYSKKFIITHKAQHKLTPRMDPLMTGYFKLVFLSVSSTAVHASIRWAALSNTYHTWWYNEMRKKTTKASITHCTELITSQYFQSQIPWKALKYSSSTTNTKLSSEAHYYSTKATTELCTSKPKHYPFLLATTHFCCFRICCLSRYLKRADNRAERVCKNSTITFPPPSFKSHNKVRRSGCTWTGRCGNPMTVWPLPCCSLCLGVSTAPHSVPLTCSCLRFFPLAKVSVDNMKF